MRYFSHLHKQHLALENYFTTIKNSHTVGLFLWHEKSTYFLPKNSQKQPLFHPFLASACFFLLIKTPKLCSKMPVCATFPARIHFYTAISRVRKFQNFTFVHNHSLLKSLLQNYRKRQKFQK